MRSLWNLVRIFVLIKSGLWLNFGQSGSKTRSNHRKPLCRQHRPLFSLDLVYKICLTFRFRPSSSFGEIQFSSQELSAIEWQKMDIPPCNLSSDFISFSIMMISHGPLVYRYFNIFFAFWIELSLLTSLNILYKIFLITV